MATPFAVTRDGHKAQWQTNYLAHWVLTERLLPLLRASRTGAGGFWRRSLSGMYSGRIEPRAPRPPRRARRNGFIVQALVEKGAAFRAHGLLGFRSFGYGHSFGVLSHYYGREAGVELREDVETALRPGMVVSMEPMLSIPEGMPGAGGYREHDILVIAEGGAEDITGFPFGPEHNIL